MCNCRSFLQVQTVTVGSGQLLITIAPQPLNDGFWYTLKLDQALPVLTGAETVFIANGTQIIQLTDRRARALLSERLLPRYCCNERRLRMLFTENSVGSSATTGVPAFLVFEGISPIV